MSPEQYNAHVDAIVVLAQSRSTFSHCCKKGCSHCCYEPAYADQRQIDHIVAGLTPEQIEEVKAKLPNWIAKSEELRTKHERPGALAWRALHLACPLLKDGLCMAYDRRPMDCRIFFATGNPDDCKMPARAHQKFAAYSGYCMQTMVRPWVESARQARTAIVLDHISVLLAERLLHLRVESAARIEITPTEGQPEGKP